MLFPVLIEEAVGPNGKGHAVILMREDGAFELRVLRKERATDLEHTCWERRIEDYDLCAVTETLSALENLISEELDH
jgi:hypothetical protein